MLSAFENFFLLCISYINSKPISTVLYDMIQNRKITIFIFAILNSRINLMSELDDEEYTN